MGFGAILAEPLVFTARCTTAKRGLAIACRLSVCDVDGSGPYTGWLS